MPHSGGGGSFGGGFHASSGSSSSYSHGRAVSHRTSTSYFPGAYTYLYYLHGQPHYRYTDYDLEKEEEANKIGGIVACLFIAIVFGIVSYFMITDNQYKDVYKVNYTEDLNIVIDDSENILNETELEEVFKEIQEETGVVYSVKTTNNSIWKNFNYYNLEDYSLEDYSLYYYQEKFDDEYHYLIVYSNDQSGWSFETMVGDNYSDYIDSDAETSFSSSIYSDLKSGKDLTQTLVDNCKSFSNIIVEGVENNSKFELKLGYVFSVISVISLIGAVIVFVHYNKKPQYIKVENNQNNNEVKPIKCPYCGEQLLSNKFKRCPFCRQRLDE